MHGSLRRLSPDPPPSPPRLPLPLPTSPCRSLGDERCGRRWMNAIQCGQTAAAMGRGRVGSEGLVMGGKARKKPAQPPAQPAAAPAPSQQQPAIHEATRLPGGAVRKGKAITQAQAEALRQSGQDVVVCGPSHVVNMNLARDIEYNANGSYKRCGPHAWAGPNGLPHYQPDPRPPSGHTFYETANRHAL
jgi:hypothetical protein